MSMIKKVDDLVNLIGASFRWLFGWFFQNTFGHEKLTFNVCLNGSEDRDHIVGEIGHRNANWLFAALVIVPLFLGIVDLIQSIWL